MSVVSGVSEVSVSISGVSEPVSVSKMSVVSIGISFTFSKVMERSSIDKSAHSDGGGPEGGSGISSGLSQGLVVVGLGGLYIGVKGSNSAVVVVHQGSGGMSREAHQNQRLHDGYCV